MDRAGRNGRVQPRAHRPASGQRLDRALADHHDRWHAHLPVYSSGLGAMRSVGLFFYDLLLFVLFIATVIGLSIVAFVSSFGAPVLIVADAGLAAVLIVALVWSRVSRWIARRRGVLRPAARSGMRIAAVLLLANAAVWAATTALNADLLLPGLDAFAVACALLWLASMIVGGALWKGRRWALLPSAALALAGMGLVMVGWGGALAGMADFVRAAGLDPAAYAKVQEAGLAMMTLLATLVLCGLVLTERAGRKLPNFADGASGQFLYLQFWWAWACILLAGSAAASQDHWWRLGLGRQVQAAIESTDGGGSVETMRVLARQRPDELRLAYMLADSYIRSGGFLQAALVMRYYRKQAFDHHLTLSSIREGTTFRPTYVEQREFSLLDYIDDSLNRAADNIYSIYAGTRLGQVQLLNNYYPQDILLRAAAKTGNEAVLNLDWFDMTSVACSKFSECAEAFKSGSLTTAVLYGTADIRFPAGGKTCCALDLGDPDLALLRIPNSLVNPLRGTTTAKAYLAVASRMLFKQFYLRNFIANAPP
jgi:hypothetical protein